MSPGAGMPWAGGPGSGPAAARRPTVTVPVTMSDDGLAERDGVEAKTVIVEQLARALELIRRHDPARILTRLGQQLYRLSLRFRRL
jgi:hypothetical protein